MHCWAIMCHLCPQHPKPLNRLTERRACADMPLNVINRRRCVFIWFRTAACYDPLERKQLDTWVQLWFSAKSPFLINFPPVLSLDKSCLLHSGSSVFCRTERVLDKSQLLRQGEAEKHMCYQCEVRRTGIGDIFPTFSVFPRFSV